VPGRNIRIPAAAATPEPRMHGHTALSNGCCQHSTSPLQHPRRKPDVTAHVRQLVSVVSLAYSADTDVISEANKQRVIRGSVMYQSPTAKTLLFMRKIPRFLAHN